MRSAKAVVSENLARYGKAGPNMSYNTMSGSQSHQHTLTSLKRWSVANTELPGARTFLMPHVNTPANNVPVIAVSQIKAIHVYDFDNTRE